MNDTIGIFYELPDGRIAKTYGWNGSTNTISYYFGDDEVGRSTTIDDWLTWQPRRDLVDFDVSRDIRLPFEFDLIWGLKNWSDLKRAIEEGHPEILDIKDAMEKNEIIEELVISLKIKQ